MASPGGITEKPTPGKADGKATNGISPATRTVLEDCLVMQVEAAESQHGYHRPRNNLDCFPQQHSLPGKAIADVPGTLPGPA